MSTDIHALAGAYALDAVTDLERAAFARHVANCETCALDVVELQEVAGRLADATWSVPPPTLKDNVLLAISRTRQIPPGQPERVVAAGAAALAGWRRWTAAAVAAGIIGIGVGTTTFVVQEQRVRAERERAVAAETDAVQRRAVLTAPDVAVRTAPVGGGGHLTVLTSAQQDAGIVLLDGVAGPGTGSVYQMWLLRGTSPSDAGMLPAGQAESTRLITDVRGADGFAITIEPAGGSAAPTTTPVVSVRLT